MIAEDINMNSRKLKLLIGASLLALAGCGGGGDDSGGGLFPTPPVVIIPGQGTLENMFGTGFGALFRAEANSDPADPKDSDVIALTLLVDAVPVP